MESPLNAAHCAQVGFQSPNTRKLFQAVILLPLKGMSMERKHPFRKRLFLVFLVALMLERVSLDRFVFDPWS